MVVGREAAQTPSLFKVFSSIPLATNRGGAHWREREREGEREKDQKKVGEGEGGEGKGEGEKEEKERERRGTSKQASFPGVMSWMWPDIASSETPLSIQVWFNSTQA